MQGTTSFCVTAAVFLSRNRVEVLRNQMLLDKDFGPRQCLLRGVGSALKKLSDPLLVFHQLDSGLEIGARSKRASERTYCS